MMTVGFVSCLNVGTMYMQSMYKTMRLSSRNCVPLLPPPTHSKSMQCLVGTEVFTTQRRAGFATVSEELQLSMRTTGTEILRMVSGKCVKCLDRALEEGESVRWGNVQDAIYKLNLEEVEAEKVESGEIYCEWSGRGWATVNAFGGKIPLYAII